MSRSWFYLTLWHGTPPEFTSEFDVKINDTSPVDAMIRTADAVETDIDTIASLSADIRSHEAIGTTNGSTNMTGTTLAANTPVECKINGSDLSVAAGGADGTYIIKVFGQASANDLWSA